MQHISTAVATSGSGGRPSFQVVFNLHAQFEELREAGRYEKLRSSILQRDEVLAGSANPMLARHGEVSEARQYSGRAVDESWRCPFRPRTANGEARNVR